MNDEQTQAIACIWEAIRNFVDKRKADGADSEMIHIWLSAALMDAATVIGYSRGLDEKTFCLLAAEHFRLTERHLAEVRAKVSN